LQYHYLQRPYKLVPLAVTQMPQPVLLAADGERLPDDAPDDTVAASVWTIHIKHGVRYQPHPAFAKDAQGQPLYMHVTAADIRGIKSPMDFEHMGTRELVAADYVYEIKRLADPHVTSPIFSLMAKHIKGFKAFADKVRAARKQLQAKRGDDAFLDLSTLTMSGLQIVDRYTFR